jgi:hypothetical protein
MMINKQLLLMVLCFLSFFANGQTKDRIIVKYADNSLPGILPSGTEFIIEGKAISPSGKQAKAVKLIIVDSDNKMFESNTWIKTDNNDIFQLTCSQQLYPGRKYSFKLQFFVEAEITPKQADLILNSIIDSSVAQFTKNLGISFTQQKQIIQKESNKIGVDYPFFGYIENDSLRTGIKILLNDDLKNFQKDKDINSNEAFKKTDFGKILLKASNYKELNLASLRAQFKDSISSEYSIFLDALDSKIQKLNKFEANQNDSLNRIIKKLISAKVISQENNEVVVKTNEIKTSENSSDRIGLRYGIAYCNFFDKNKNVFIANIVAVRFYFRAIDKSMNSPYSDWRSRVSLNLGSVVSSMQLNGITLQNTDLGIKLVTGLSLDINKNFSFSAGSIWYNINEGTPFNSVSKSKAVFYFALTFDFNLLENLKK